MTNWKLTIDVVEPWNNLKNLSDDDRYDESTFFPLLDALVAKLKVYARAVERLDVSGDFGGAC